MHELGRSLVVLGVILVIVGAVVLGLGRAGLPLGRMPGDISYRGKHFAFFAPLGTSLLLSVGLTIILYLISRFRR